MRGGEGRARPWWRAIRGQAVVNRTCPLHAPYYTATEVDDGRGKEGVKEGGKEGRKQCRKE